MDNLTINNKQFLTLKFGKIKHENFITDEAKKLYTEYESYFPANDNITDRQKELICELIDLCDDDCIFMEWDDIYLPKNVAKEYVLNYKNR